MTAPHALPAPDAPAPPGRPGAQGAFDPEALERRRFDRDRSQAVLVMLALLVPIAAFAVNDALLAGPNPRQVAIAWTVRALGVLALATAGLQLHRARSRVLLERVVFWAVMVGVALMAVTHFGRPRDSLLPTRFELLCVVGVYVALPLRTRLQMVPALLLSGVSLSLVFFWHTGVSVPELVSHVMCFALANVLGILITRRRHAAEAEEDAAWRAVTFAHASLQKSVRELRALRGVVPICPSCRKVRGAREAWQQLEAFVAERGDVEFSQILCPACLQKDFGAVLVEGDEPA